MKIKNAQLILALSLAMSLPVSARLFHVWTKAERETAADLIVIGAVADVRDLDETNTTLWPGNAFRGVETTFSISQVLKGDVTNSTVVLHHYRFEAVIPPNAPSFLNLKAGDTNQYLLYLVKDGASRYAPVSGQLDPAMDAVMVYSASDPIGRLMANLSATHGLWMNGRSPAIRLPETASTGQVLEQVFRMTGFDQGHVTSFKILTTRQIRLDGGSYTAALVQTNLGEKVVLFTAGGGWSRVFDSPAPSSNEP